MHGSALCSASIRPCNAFGNAAWAGFRGTMLPTSSAPCPHMPPRHSLSHYLSDFELLELHSGRGYHSFSRQTQERVAFRI